MFLNYFILDEMKIDSDERASYLFRHKSSELLTKNNGSAFDRIFSFDRAFSLHLIFDNRISSDKECTNLLERIFLIVGRVNYHSTLGRKVLFVSYANTESQKAIRFISKLKSLLANKIYITQIPCNDSAGFISSLNVSVEKSESEIESHFVRFMEKMVKQNTIVSHKYIYCIITSEGTNYDRLNRALAGQLQHVPDLLSLLNGASYQIGLLTEELNHTQKEKLSLLQTIAFLKKEVKYHFAEREESKNAARNSELASILRKNKRIEEMRNRYIEEYENLPQAYKKIGTLIKLLLGKVEFGYFINRRQKRDFLDLLHTLPEDKQIEIWYYYEYEVLPEWYKKIGRALKKNNDKS